MMMAAVWPYVETVMSFYMFVTSFKRLIWASVNEPPTKKGPGKGHYRVVGFSSLILFYFTIERDIQIDKDIDGWMDR